jgi:hypothetical protein
VVCRTCYLVPGVPVHSICIATHFQIIIVVTTGKSGLPGNGLYVHTQYPVDEDKTWLFDISINPSGELLPVMILNQKISAALPNIRPAAT